MNEITRRDMTIVWNKYPDAMETLYGGQRGPAGECRICSGHKTLGRGLSFETAWAHASYTVQEESK